MWKCNTNLFFFPFFFLYLVTSQVSKKCIIYLNHQEYTKQQNILIIVMAFTLHIPAVHSPFPCRIFPFPHSVWFPGRSHWPLVLRLPFLARRCSRFSHWTWSPIYCGSCFSCCRLLNDECKKFINSSILKLCNSLLNVVYFVRCTIILYLCNSITAIYLFQLITETNGINQSFCIFSL